MNKKQEEQMLIFMNFISLCLLVTATAHESFCPCDRSCSHEESEECIHWHIPYESLPEEWQVNISDPSCSELFWDYLISSRKIEGKSPKKALKDISSVFIYIRIPVSKRHCKQIRIRVDFPLDHPEFFWKEL